MLDKKFISSKGAQAWNKLAEHYGWLKGTTPLSEVETEEVV